jgi:glycosyltransferase involved in cell wall biosynthesis
VSEGKARVLMPVYNPIDFDGRVQRIAAAVGAEYDVTVLSVSSRRPFAHPDFRVRAVELPGEGASKAGMHLRFLRALLREAAALRPAVVHAHDFFMAGPGWLAARTCGAKLVYDAHELIVPAPGERLSRRDRFWYRVEAITVGRADLVIAANRERAEVMRTHYGLACTPLAIRNIPPVPEGAAHDPLPIAPGGEVRLVYQGDMSMDRGIGSFVSAMRRLPEEIRLLLVGGGPDVEALRALAAREGVADRVVLVGKVPRAELHGILRTCHVGVITYPERGLNNVLCAPNKLYEYAQAGLPMVGSVNPVLCHAFDEFGVGAADPDPASAVLRVVGDLAGFRAALPRFVREHRWEGEAEKLLRAYRSLLQTDHD